MRKEDRTSPWLDWAVELQALSQAGLHYGKDPFDIERYQRIRDISAEMLAWKAALPLETVKGLFCCETGYQTPKLDTRAAVFREGKILLVRENSGKWSLPGGWVDVNVSVLENAAKEVREEAGLEVIPQRVIAVQDREKHNRPVYAWKVCKIFVLCAAVGGEFRPNTETTASGYLSPEDLPPLAEEKNTEEQVRMCFDAHRAETWETLFD